MTYTQWRDIGHGIKLFWTQGNLHGNASRSLSVTNLLFYEEMAGTESLIGCVIPDDMPEEIKTKMKFAIANPNTFEMKRK